MTNRVEQILGAKISIREKKVRIAGLKRLRSEERIALDNWRKEIAEKSCHVSRWRDCSHPKQKCRGLRLYEMEDIAYKCEFNLYLYVSGTEAIRNFAKSEEYARYKRYMADYGTYIHEACSIDELSFSVRREKTENACEFRGYLVHLDAWVYKDWSYYAKSYGFPKTEVDDREVTLRRAGKAVSLPLKSFRQSEILEAIATHFKWQKPSRSTLNRKFATSAWFDVQPSVKKGGISFYKQIFCNEVVGYVAVKDDLTFHASSIEDAKSGLEHKIEAEKKILAAKEGRVYAANSVNTSYGFCFPGMREFCESVGLDLFGSYTFKEIKEAMAKCPRNLITKYRRELKLFGLI